MCSTDRNEMKLWTLINLSEHNELLTSNDLLAPDELFTSNDLSAENELFRYEKSQIFLEIRRENRRNQWIEQRLLVRFIRIRTRHSNAQQWHSIDIHFYRIFIIIIFFVFLLIFLIFQWHSQIKDENTEFIELIDWIA